jgi:hypothetical protein
LSDSPCSARRAGRLHAIVHQHFRDGDQSHLLQTLAVQSHARFRRGGPRLQPRAADALRECRFACFFGWGAYAKANRGKLSIAFDNTAGAAAFAAKLFNKQADLGLVEVPYRSAAQATQDVASGINQVMMSSIAAANAVVQAGKVRRLAVTSGKRFPGLPDLPSLHETVPGIVMDGFFCGCGASRHTIGSDRTTQSRDRSLPQRPRWFSR